MHKVSILIVTDIVSKTKWYKIPGTPWNKNNIKIKNIGEISFDQVIFYEDEIEFRSEIFCLKWKDNYKEIITKKLFNIFKSHKIKAKTILVYLEEEDIFSRFNKKLWEGLNKLRRI